MLGVQMVPMVPMAVQGIIVVAAVVGTIVITRMGVQVVRDVVQGIKELISTRNG
jgi:hypothetical protein